MYRAQRQRSTPSSNAARLAAEAAFSPPPREEPPPSAISNALIVVKKKRSLDNADRDTVGDDSHAADGNRSPRIFRVPTPVVSELAGQLSEGHAPGHDVAPSPALQRRTRRASAARSGPVVNIAAAAHEPVDLAALAIELEASMTARAHAEVEARLDQLQAELGRLDVVLALIAKARDFTLADMQLSTQWQQLMQAAAGLAESLIPRPLAPA